MEYREIRIIDSGSDKYKQVAPEKCLGRQYDNDAVSIKIIRPEVEQDSTCFMIVTDTYGAVLDQINMSKNETSIKRHLSKYQTIQVGFYFMRANGYVKNCAIEKYNFAPALDPNSTIETPPEQETNINLILEEGFVDVKWKEGKHNVLEFTNLNGDVVSEIELSGFLQEQSDLGEIDETKETFVKGKKTSNLFNDGDGKSRFATEDFVVGQVPEVDFSEIEEQINDVRAVAEGKTKSFTVASLAGLGAILGIDTSVVADEYEITTTEIVYKDKLYTLHQGDLFIIVDTQVPDYWVSIDDMKIYKMETSKVDLTGLATETYVQDQIASAITTTLNTGV